MRYVTLSVHRNESDTVVSSYFPWEIPLLQALYGAERVVEVGEVTVEREYPSAEAEFDRLSRRYGSNADNVPLVVSVYGAAPFGLQRLEGEMNRYIGIEEAARAAEENAALEAATAPEPQPEPEPEPEPVEVKAPKTLSAKQNRAQAEAISV
jgi:hypothetical protein